MLNSKSYPNIHNILIMNNTLDVNIYINCFFFSFLLFSSSFFYNNINSSDKTHEN